MSAKIIDGKAIAQRIRAETAGEVRQFRERTGITPHLAAVLAGDDPASAVYVRNKQRDCEKAGIKSTLHRLSHDTSQPQLLELVERLNVD
ncbi:MAG: tetrahydrofolate dehydrogenase/cyclohydrolase catalytic domain-containing protein, partial [Planctomycetaceae bacterium]